MFGPGTPPVIYPLTVGTLDRIWRREKQHVPRVPPRRRPAETRRRLRDDSDVGFPIHVEIHREMRSQHFEEVARTPPLRERAGVTSDPLLAVHTPLNRTALLISCKLAL